MPERLRNVVTCSICKKNTTDNVQEFRVRKKPYEDIRIFQVICDECMAPDPKGGETIEQYLSLTKGAEVEYVGLLKKT